MIHFTCGTYDRRRAFQTYENAGIALDAIVHYGVPERYLLHAAAVMPDHLHVLFTPAANVLLERCASVIKGGISYRLRDKINGELWQDGYHDVRMRNREQAMKAADYIRENPVEDGLKDWPFVIYRPETI